MRAKVREKRYRILTIFIMSCVLSIAILPGISSGVIKNLQTGAVYTALDNAIEAASDGQTLQLISNTSVTLTPGNITAIAKSLTIQQNQTSAVRQFSILMNGTIAFNGTLKTYTLATGNPLQQSFIFSYDPTGPAVFQNNSLFEITGSSNTFSVANPHPRLVSGTFTGTGVNVTGYNNSFSSFIGETKAGVSHMSVVFNLSGSYNTIDDTPSCQLETDASGGVGLNVIGNFNTVSLDTTQITSAPGGIIYIAPTANGNVIKDIDSNLNPAQQQIYLYNGTAANTATLWYFFNNTWAPSGRNHNPTVDTSQWKFPFGGNVSLIAGFSNVTGQSTDFVRNSSLFLDTTTGKSNGILMNDTSSLKFATISAVVPVGMSIGNNTYRDSNDNTASSLGYLGYVTILNFDPYNSLPGENFNKTQTTSWGTIPDFRTAHNLTFVAENPATHALLGNVSYNQDLNLITSGIDSGLSVFGSNFNISSTGNSTNFTMTNAALNSVFNNPATLTMYPNGFPFPDAGNITIIATTDSGTRTTLFDKGVWLNRAGFVDASQTVTVVENTSITLPVLHFSTFDFYHAIPNASFTGTPRSGYTPLTVQFNDTSAYSPTSWNWAFGDDDPTNSTRQNPVHTYISAGSYTVSLTAANTGGSNTTTIANYINVSALPPIPSFTSNITFGYVPQDVQFNDTTVSTGILSWNWSFGDTGWFNTTLSSARNATHTYTSSGSYTVNLSITNSTGLITPPSITNTTSVTNYVNISAGIPVPAFTSNITFGYVPQDVQFNDTTMSPNIQYWNWSFGDNTPWFNTTDINLRNITHTYTSVGSYTVSLSVTNKTGLSTPFTNTNTTSFANYINVSNPLPLPSFTSNITFGYVPQGVQFNDTTLSTSNLYWNWSFGDNTWFNTTVSSLRNATHTYSSAGSFTVNLSITNSSGLSVPATNTNTTSRTDYITIVALPFPDFTGSPRSGNATLKVQFNDTSLSPGVTMWNWSFGDNTWFNTTSVTARNTTHPYSAEGSYSVSLSLTNSSGTNSTSRSGYILVGPPLPVPDFTGSPTTGNPPLNVQFNDTSPSPGITQWNWSFGDNSWFNTTGSAFRNATHTYSTIGTFTVNLTVTNSTGVNMTSRSGYISTTPPPPLPLFTGSPVSGVAPLLVQFTDLSTSPGLTMWNWSFGDGHWFNTTNTAQRNAQYTYESGGSYTVNLSLTNSSGTNMTSRAGYISVTALPNGVDFSATPTSGIIPLIVQFTDLSTAPGIIMWNWSFGDGHWFNTTDTTQRNAQYTYVDAGSYRVNLSVTNSSGTNTTSKFGFITASKPTTTTPTPGSSGSSGGGGGGSPSWYVPAQETPPVLSTAAPQVSLAIPPVKPPSYHIQTTMICLLPEGLQFRSPSDGMQQFLFDTSKAEHAGYTVEIKGNSVTATKSNNLLVIDGTNIRKSGSGLITGSVQRVSFVVQPDPADVNLGEVSVTGEASLPTLSEHACINITISDLVPNQTLNAFQRVAAQQDREISAVGYTATFRKDGIISTGPGIIRMTSPPAWVDQHGGNPAVSIVRIGDDKLTELLTTTYTGTDESGNRAFEAPTPHGFSIFGLVALKSRTGTAGQNVIPVPKETQNAMGFLSLLPPEGSIPYWFMIFGCLALIVIIMVAAWKRWKKYDWLFMR
jgi:PKD repeat protein